MPGEEPLQDGLATPAFRARLRRREPEAWEALYDACGDRIRRIAWRILPDRHDPEAAAQQVWVQAIHRARRIDLQRPTEPWLASICVNLCVGLLRRDGRRRDLLGDRSKVPATPASSLGRIPGHKTDGSRVREGVRRLSRDQQQIVYLRFACDMRYGDIATVLGVAEATVRKRLSRAYARLRADLGGDAGLESLGAS